MIHLISQTLSQIFFKNQGHYYVAFDKNGFWVLNLYSFNRTRL